MKKIGVVLAALAAVVAIGSGTGVAWAYFTTYAEAQGGQNLELGDWTEIEEDFYDWTKHVSIVSEPGSQPVYIRAKAFCGGDYLLEYSSESGKWEPGGDGYYYYGDILNGGETAEELLVRIQGIPADEELEDGDSFNVVVIYESAPVRYGADGTPLASLLQGEPNPEIWSAPLVTGGVQ